MAEGERRRNIIIVLIILVLLLLLLMFRCKPNPPAATPPQSIAAPAASEATTAPVSAPPATTTPTEVLTPATLTVPAKVVAGAVCTVAWKGPNNPGDYVILVPKDAPVDGAGHFQLTEQGPSLELTAPVEPGPCEVRYITGQSRTILGRAPVEVAPAGATLDAVAEVMLGADFSVAWTGPNNEGDYVTIVAPDAHNDRYGSYVNTSEGSPVKLTAPPEAGDFELRYVTGKLGAAGHKVLARRGIKVTAPEVSLTAPAEAVAGSSIEVVWKGPDNPGDYITVVVPDMPDGQYANYSNTSGGSPLKLLLPIMDGPAQLRYQTGQGNKVLARRPIRITAAKVTLEAAPESAVDKPVSIKWTGPNHPGDYITLVPKALPDGQYRAYTNTTEGSPLEVKSPKEPGEAEIRYMTGQGNKVLARIPIKVTP